MSARRRCAACGKLFGVRPQTPDQSYCADQACQRERKKLWQRDRRTTDPDYRDNQARAQEAWLARNPDYWRRYRQRNPEYTQLNRERQRDRMRELRDSSVEPFDAAEIAANLLKSGVYRLRVVAVHRIAKMDASFLVELIPVKRSDEP
jgi:hypothetical protein